MNLIIFLLLCLILFCLLMITKDLLSTPVILACVWIIPFLWILITEGIGNNGYCMDKLGLIFPLGVVIFSVGYFIANPHIYKTQDVEVEYEAVKMSKIFKSFIVLEALITIYHMYSVLSYALNHFVNNLWYSYKYAKDMGYYAEAWFIPYFRTASRAMFCVVFVYLLLKQFQSKEKKWIYIQILITFIMHLLGPGRNELFAILIPGGFAYIIIKSKNIGDIIKKAAGIGLILLGVFFGFYLMKFTSASAKVGVTAASSFQKYLCGGVISFIDWANLPNHNYGHGAYTLRFFYALLHGFGFDVKVVSIVEEFQKFLGNQNGNVYTVYKWYANDFGVVYAVCMQFLFGLIHGGVAKRFYIKKDITSMVIFAISFFPLFMQFFDDEYISKTSTWIQFGFWLFLVLKTDLFFKKKYEKYKSGEIT